MATESHRIARNPAKDAPKAIYARILQRRNEWMVNNGEVGIGVYISGNRGGTHNCLQYANKQNKPVLVLNPTTMQDAWMFVKRA
jgi:hypothetical protein